MIRKEEIIRNTLIQEIVRIDMFKIMDISNILKIIDPIMKEYGFEFTSNDVYDINISINDPQELITQKFITNINKTTNYQYIKNDENFVLNEFMIFFQKSKFKGYRNIDNYLELFANIMEKIIENENVSIKRIGIRKINRIIGKKLDVISKVFKDDDIDLDEITKYKGYKNDRKKILQDEEKNSMNVFKSMDKGIGVYKGKEMQMYSTTLDIDAYCRNFKENINIQEIKDKMNELSEEVYHQFISYENETLLRILTNKDDIKDLEIYGGVNDID